MSDLTIMAKILDGLASKFDAFVAAWSNIDSFNDKLCVRVSFTSEKTRITNVDRPGKISVQT